jgi:hypothetical protein
MRRAIAQTLSSASGLRRALDLWWPYVFIAVSIGGLAYMALHSTR